jgi:hypothetical protein
VQLALVRVEYEALRAFCAARFGALLHAELRVRLPQLCTNLLRRDSECEREAGKSDGRKHVGNLAESKVSYRRDDKMSAGTT